LIYCPAQYAARLSLLYLLLLFAFSKPVISAADSIANCDRLRRDNPSTATAALRSLLCPIHFAYALSDGRDPPIPTTASSQFANLIAQNLAFEVCKCRLARHSASEHGSGDAESIDGCPFVVLEDSTDAVKIVIQMRFAVILVVFLVVDPRPTMT
jgi:hypothetical protein